MKKKKRRKYSLVLYAMGFKTFAFEIEPTESQREALRKEISILLEQKIDKAISTMIRENHCFNGLIEFDPHLMQIGEDVDIEDIDEDVIII